MKLWTISFFSKENFLVFILFLSSFLLLFNKASFSQENGTTRKTMEVGVAQIDITPDIPIRLTGYAHRGGAETDSVYQKLWAKALVLGSDNQKPTVIITVDLVGITRRITSKVVDFLSKEKGIDSAQIAIFASHTHSGPGIGSLMNILCYQGGHGMFSRLPLDQLIHIAEYTEQLTQKLKEVAVAALKNRRPAYVSWGKGQVRFATNRRTKGGPVNWALPMLKITNPDSSLRAVFLNYACHGTTLTGKFNMISGDWIGQAAQDIEARHPGAMALIALGTAGDADPSPRGTIEDLKLHGKQIADNVDKLLTAQLQPLNAPPTGEMRWVELPLEKVPSVPELIRLARDTNTVRGYEARLTLERIERGEPVQSTVDYPIQIWNFDNKMAMVNLGGEVVVDYSIFLKKKYGAEHLWINAYANHVPCYIPSKRILKEGGYEAVGDMYWYNKPSTLNPEVQGIILHTVDNLMPGVFKTEQPVINQQKLIQQGEDGIYNLPSWLAGTVGNHIKYMPEWKAFGCFKTTDQAVWKVDIKKSGRYDVYLEYAVSNKEAGKHFILESENKKLKDKVVETGSWFTYENKKVGSIRLRKGIQKIILKSGSNKEDGLLFDLRKIKLILVK
jgi:hypothetical protein